MLALITWDEYENNEYEDTNDQTIEETNDMNQTLSESNTNDEILMMTNDESSILEKNVHAVMNEYELWLGDTGASCHVTNDGRYMINKKEAGKDRVVVGDRSRCSVQFKGMLKLQNKENEEIELNDIRVVERMAKSIISIGQLLKEGGRMSGDDDKLIIIMKSAKIIFVKNKVDGLYYTKLQRDNLHDDYCNNVNENEWEIINRTKKR